MLSSGLWGRTSFDRSGAGPGQSNGRGLNGPSPGRSKCSSPSPLPTAVVTWPLGSIGSCHRNGCSKSFRHSASGNKEKAEPLFLEYLQIVTVCAEKGVLPFNNVVWRRYLESYLAGGVRPVHHSKLYRLREQPAYRIVKREYERVLPILKTQIKL